MEQANLAKNKLVITSRDGHKIVQAGDIIEESVPGTVPIESIRSVGGHKPKDAGPEWAGGRPLEIIVSGIKTKVSRSRRDNNMGDMDCILPERILARRKKLVMDRMRQERL